MALDDALWLENAGAVYNAEEYRHLLQALVGLTAGILSPLDMKVSQRGAGANKSVDITKGNAVIKGSESVPEQGMYLAHNDATVNLIIPDAESQPRYDIVVVRVHDSAYSGATDSVAFEVKKGTAAATPSEPTLDANSMSLARILVPASSTTVVDANITDRRNLVGPENFPQGRLVYQALGVATGPGIGASATPVNGSSIVRTTRAGGYHKYGAAIRFHCNAANNVGVLQVQRDGTNIGAQFDVPFPIVNQAQTVLIEAHDTPPAGSHTYRVVASIGVGSGSGTVDSSGWCCLEDLGAGRA